MTTECIVIHKQDRKNADKLYQLYFALGNELPFNIELEPVSVSKIIKKHRAFSNINTAMGYQFGGKQTTLKPDDLCIFLLGKDWHMNKTEIRSYLSAENKKLLTEFEIMHPEYTDDTEPFFVDI